MDARTNRMLEEDPAWLPTGLRSNTQGMRIFACTQRAPGCPGWRDPGHPRYCATRETSDMGTDKGVRRNAFFHKIMLATELRFKAENGGRPIRRTSWLTRAFGPPKQVNFWAAKNCRFRTRIRFCTALATYNDIMRSPNPVNVVWCLIFEHTVSVLNVKLLRIVQLGIRGRLV